MDREKEDHMNLFQEAINQITAPTWEGVVAKVTDEELDAQYEEEMFWLNKKAICKYQD